MAFHGRAYETFPVCQVPFAKCNALSEGLLVTSQQFKPSHQSGSFESRDLWWLKSNQCEHGRLWKNETALKCIKFLADSWCFLAPRFSFLFADGLEVAFSPVLFVMQYFHMKNDIYTTIYLMFKIVHNSWFIDQRTLFSHQESKHRPSRLTEEARHLRPALRIWLRQPSLTIQRINSCLRH